MMYHIRLSQLPPLLEEEDKFREEMDEFVVEIINGNIEGILEEGLDVIQTAIHIQLLNRLNIPFNFREYEDVKIANILIQDRLILLKKVGDRFLEEHWYITFLAVVNNVLRIFKHFNISEKQVKDGIKKHNEKLKNRGWDLVPIGGKIKL